MPYIASKAALPPPLPSPTLHVLPRVAGSTDLLPLLLQSADSDLLKNSHSSAQQQQQQAGVSGQAEQEPQHPGNPGTAADAAEGPQAKRPRRGKGKASPAAAAAAAGASGKAGMDPDKAPAQAQPPAENTSCWHALQVRAMHARYAAVVL